MLPLILIQVLTFTLVLLTSAYVFRRKKPRNFPPGPFPLPVIGNLHQIGMEPHKAFKEMGKRYGSVFAVDMGSISCVVLNDTKTIKEAFSNDAFSGRPKLKIFVDRSGGLERGVVLVSGRAWIEQRRFIIKTLRGFGYGRKSMEEMIQQEIQGLIELFETKVGQPLLMKGVFNGPVLNSLWHMTTGERFEYNDPYFRKVVHIITEAISETGSLAGACNFFPAAATLFPNWSGYNQIMKIMRTAHEYVTTVVDRHKAHPLGEGEPRDFVDAYFREISNEKDPHSSFFGKVGESNLTVTLSDLFLGGAETTSTALSWVVFLLAHNPRQQEKLYSEIQSVVGDSRIPELADREKMPFTQAVIMEVLRMSTIFPLSVPRSTTKDVHFHGYFIPKDTVIFPNLYAASRDESIWEDPDSFRPERFILSGGEVDLNNDSVVAFSAGKRQCLGERLARDELFLFVTTIFQKFNVAFDPSRPIPGVQETKVAVTNSPKDYYIVLEKRL